MLLDDLNTRPATLGFADLCYHAELNTVEIRYSTAVLTCNSPVRPWILCLTTSSIAYAEGVGVFPLSACSLDACTACSCFEHFVWI
jgi:hypothetical protein